MPSPASSKQRGVPKILIEDRREIVLESCVEESHDVLGHDVLVLKLLIEVANQRPPGAVVVDDAAKRVQEQRALEVHVLLRLSMDAALRDDRLAILDLGLVAVHVPDRLVVPEQFLDVQTLEVRRPSLVNPHVRDVGR